MKKIILLILAVITLQVARAQDLYRKSAFSASNSVTLNYREMEPANADPNEKYPLVLFMHGAGERGSDNVKQLTHGSGMFENPVNRAKYPAYVLFPQCPENSYWAFKERPKTFTADSIPFTETPAPLITAVKELLDNYIDRPEIDKNRIYIIGLSMGAMATYELTGRYPDLFTAAIPICGTVNPKRLENAQAVKYRIYHGDADPVVPVAGSRNAYLKLKDIGAEVEYIEFPGINHNSWTPAFNQPDFMDWLFNQNKESNPEADIKLD